MAAHIEVLPEPLPTEPLAVVSRWLQEAWAAHAQPNANAMVLATSSRAGAPERPRGAVQGHRLAARLRRCSTPTICPPRGEQLKANPRAAAVMHWDALQRQVRIEGPVTRAPAADSDRYFAERAWQSRIGAWASDQSAADRLARAAARRGAEDGAPLRRPDAGLPAGG